MGPIGASMQTAVMDTTESAVITIRRAILERFLPGPEREKCLAWLQAMRAHSANPQAVRKPSDTSAVLDCPPKSRR
jgi:hypothetical protein